MTADTIPIEQAVPACSCHVCRHPTTDNELARIQHAERHAAFMDWLALREDALSHMDLPAARRPRLLTLRERLQR